MFQRRDFLAGVAALPLVGTPVAGPFRRRRFAAALGVVVNEKVREGEIVIPVTALKERVEYRGRAATVGDHVFDEVELPWYYLAWEAICQWIRENWDVILKFLLTVLPFIILEPGNGKEKV